jgi:excisionase family DNA binding protein
MSKRRSKAVVEPTGEDVPPRRRRNRRKLFIEPSGKNAPPRPTLTPEEFAWELGVSRQALMAAIRAGKIEAIWIGSRARIARTVADRVLKRGSHAE